MIYFDNAATTVCDTSATEKIIYMLKDCFGNPSSLHKLGEEAADELLKSREEIAALLGAREDEIIFTSGATESNNLCILGALSARKRNLTGFVYSLAEHESILSIAKKAESLGFLCKGIKPLSSTEADIESIADAVDDKTALVSLMLVNNETGAISRVKECAEKIKRKNPEALVHCDITAAFGKIPLSVKDLKIDLASMSAHKIHGPKGVGAAYIKKGVRIVPILAGSHQQGAIRPGTESTALIAGFSEAAKEAKNTISESYLRVKEISDYLKTELLKIDKISVNSPEGASPYVLNFSTNSVRSEIMLHYLEMKGIYVSSGSACKKGEPSHVLLSASKSRREADTAIRISLCKHNTLEEARVFIDELKSGLQSIIPSYK